jgi:hypothetical protein
MHEHSPDRTQRVYARVAGVAYLANYATSVFGVMMPSWIRGSGDFAERAQRVVASEHLYRTALTSMAIGWVIIVVLAFALYVTLEPVSKRLAQLALFSEIGQACIGAVTVVVSFVVLHLYTGAQASGPFQHAQLQALVSVSGDAINNGFNISMMFFALGSTVFFYLFYTSRYIPRALAGLGVFGSIVMGIVSVLSLIFPEHAATLQYGWGPMGIAEVATALWLAIVGVR